MKNKIIYHNRYSNTNYPDKRGRWARVAKFNHITIAWINRQVIDDEIVYVANCYFPTMSNDTANEHKICTSLKEAKGFIEQCWKCFMGVILVKECKRKAVTMKNKIKYSPFNFAEILSHEDLKADFGDLVANPTPYQSLPDGEYLIRGNEKYHSKIYYVKEGRWYFSHENKENYYALNDGVFNNFPKLSEKEWQKLEATEKYLSKRWKRALHAYNCWKEWREIIREIKIDAFKWDKKKRQ